MDISAFSAEAKLLPWHNTIWQRLTTRFPDVGHALLFYGKQGCGKQAFTIHLTQWLLCQNKQQYSACGKCKSCAWLAAGTHPQLKLITADFDDKKQNYTAIKIDQIREISDFVQQTVEGWRIIIIYPAEQLNIAAANALLKTLEEPGERVILILMSDAMLKLPATIRSRVQQFALDRIEYDQAKQYLLAKNHQQIQNIAITLALAEQMPLKAEQIDQSEWFKQRHEFLQAWIVLVEKKSYPIQFSMHWLKQLEFREVLTLLRYLIQDCIAYKLQQIVKQTDLDFSQLEKYYSLEQLFAIYTQINKINIMSVQNVQAQLMFDELVIRLMNVTQNN